MVYSILILSASGSFYTEDHGFLFLYLRPVRFRYLNMTSLQGDRGLWTVEWFYDEICYKVCEGVVLRSVMLKEIR